MDVAEFRDYCLSLPMVEESTPFDENVLVYKIGGKMFAYADMNGFCRFAVKCDPEAAEELRALHPEVLPAHHSDKRHWNDIRTDGALSGDFLRQQIRNSYLLVICKNVTPKSLRTDILRRLQECGFDCTADFQQSAAKKLSAEAKNSLYL